MAIDLSRLTEGLVLPKKVASEIMTNARESSAVMRLGRKIELPGVGKEIPIMTGDPIAYWTGETDEAKVSRPTFDSKTIRSYKISVLVPLSNEFLRDAGKFYREVIRSLPYAVGKRFDQTVFGPQSGAPGQDFDTLGDSASVSLDIDAFTALVTAKSLVRAGGGRLDGWALSDDAETILMLQKDAVGRPLFLGDVRDDGSVGRVLSRPVHMTDVVLDDSDRAGFAGSWNHLVYGITDDIRLTMSRDATITDVDGKQLNLFQRDMFAVRVDLEIGSRKFGDMFVALTA